ncbi:MAG: hypothetical protein QOI38_833 [Sphingomonadales bacterium]|jgi:hypothetical protein|nr:hypothetical protein [Sphingomonadales bacterium]
MGTLNRALLIFLSVAGLSLPAPAAAQAGRSAEGNATTTATTTANRPSTSTASTTAARPNDSTRPPRDRADSGHSDWAIAELVRIDQRMRDIDQQIARARSSETATADIEQATRSLAELKQSPGRACAAPAEVRAAFNLSFQQTVDTLTRLSGRLPTIYPWEEISAEQLQQLCDQPVVDAISRIESGIGSMTAELTTAADTVDDLEREREDLEERKQQIVTEMSNQVASARVAGIMPVILVIIFTLGLVMLIAARLFSPEIQSELVCSGQLIQYATILILFGALIALGLADKLQEQTLAALLGGLAGYVLSQGVGQKEQRQVLRTMRTLTGSGLSGSGGPGGGPDGGADAPATGGETNVRSAPTGQAGGAPADEAGTPSAPPR